MIAERIGKFLTADIECSNRDRLSIHPFDEGAQGRILLFFVGRRVAVHEHEFGSQQTDSFGAGGDGEIDFAR